MFNISPPPESANGNWPQGISRSVGQLYVTLVGTGLSVMFMVYTCLVRAAPKAIYIYTYMYTMLLKYHKEYVHVFSMDNILILIGI